MRGVVPPVVTGKALRLRPVTPDDAAYIYGLRTNPCYNRHLSQVTGTVADQQAWIERYKVREAANREIYYIIERLDDDVSCGTVRIYDIEVDHFTWGSWILDENKTRKAALESAVLSLGVGFDHLGLKLAHVNVRIGNTHAEAFYRRFGMTEIHCTSKDIFFKYPRGRFEEDREGYLAILKQETEG